MPESETRYQLLPPEGYTPIVGVLVAMLENSRATLLDTVRGLSDQALSRQHDPKANPIGALLAHIAAVEWVYVVSTLERRQPNGVEWDKWGGLLRLTPATWMATRGQSLATHLERLETVRASTMEGLARVNDEWLNEVVVLPWLRAPANHLWAWYHVVEDELNHRGQIRWLKARL